MTSSSEYRRGTFKIGLVCLVFVLASAWALSAGGRSKRVDSQPSWLPMVVGEPAAAAPSPTAPAREPAEAANGDDQPTRHTDLDVVDATTGSAVGGVAVVLLGGGGSVVRDEKGRWSLHREGADGVTDVEVAADGYVTERFCVAVDPCPASVTLALRRANLWSLTLVDVAGQPLPGAMLGLREVGGRSLEIVAGPADPFGHVVVRAPNGRFVPRAKVPDGLVPVAAEPNHNGHLEPPADVRVTFGHLRVAAVEVVGDEVLGGYMERTFPLSMTMGAYLGEASRLEADIVAKWPGTIASAALTQPSTTVTARLVTRWNGWVEHQCTYRDIAGFEPERLRLPEQSQDGSGLVEIDIQRSDAEPWLEHPFFVSISNAKAGGGLNLEPKGERSLRVPLGTVVPKALQPGIDAWVEIAPRRVRLSAENRFTTFLVKAREPLVRKRIQVSVQDAGLVVPYQGTLFVKDKGSVVAQWPVGGGGIDVWLPSRGIAVEGVVQIDRQNVRVAGLVSGSGTEERVMLR